MLQHHENKVLCQYIFGGKVVTKDSVAPKLVRGIMTFYQSELWLNLALGQVFVLCTHCNLLCVYILVMQECIWAVDELCMHTFIYKKL